MSKPVFVLLHGAWHKPECWKLVIQELRQAGYATEAPAMPSSGSTPPTFDWSQDIETIRNTICRLVQKQNVIIVAHSFSGITCGTALQGLDKETWLSQGLKGGVVRLIYVAAFLVPENWQHSPRGTHHQTIPKSWVNLEAGVITVPPEDAKDIFYQDVSDNMVAELVKDLQPQSFGAFWSTTTYAAWRYIPTTYILCLKDKPSTLEALQLFLEEAIGSGSHKIDPVIKHDVGHSPFISQPQWLTQTLLRESCRIWSGWQANRPAS